MLRIIFPYLTDLYERGFGLHSLLNKELWPDLRLLTLCCRCLTPSLVDNRLNSGTTPEMVILVYEFLKVIRDLLRPLNSFLKERSLLFMLKLLVSWRLVRLTSLTQTFNCWAFLLFKKVLEPMFDMTSVGAVEITSVRSLIILLVGILNSGLEVLMSLYYLTGLDRE